MNKIDAKSFKTMGPCRDGRKWIRTAKVKSLHETWDKCQRSDWMIWGLDQIGFNDEKKLRLYACECARKTPLSDGRTVWDLLIDERSRHVIEVAEHYANGQTTKGELDAAQAAAQAAAWDAARDAAQAFQADLLRQWIS